MPLTPANRKPEAVAIVGAGAIGAALARAFAGAGVRVAGIASRERQHAVRVASAIPGCRVVPISSAAAAAPIVFLTVSDDAIETACAAVAWTDRNIAVHTSGALPLGILRVARDRSAAVGAFHPLASVTASSVAGGRNENPFRGAAIAIDGGDAEYARLDPLARSIGGRPFQTAREGKPAYHLGASMVAAATVVFADIAWELFLRAGVPRGLAAPAVAHLLETIARNIDGAERPAQVLTGPIARGDAGALAAQAAEAGRTLAPDERPMYRSLARRALRAARETGRIDEPTAERLANALATPDIPVSGGST